MFYFHPYLGKWSNLTSICFKKNTNLWMVMAGYWSNRLYEVLFAGCIPATWRKNSPWVKQCCRRKREAFPFLIDFLDIMKIVVDKDLVVYIYCCTFFWGRGYFLTVQSLVVGDSWGENGSVGSTTDIWLCQPKMVFCKRHLPLYTPAKTTWIPKMMVLRR